jgi:hypothetical protein
MAALKYRIAGKCQKTYPASGFDEVVLLIVAGVPQMGAITSTLVLEAQSVGRKDSVQYPDERRLPVRVRGTLEGWKPPEAEDQASNLQPCDPTIRLNGTIVSQPVGGKLRRRSLGTSCLRRRRRQLLRLPPNLTLTRPSRKQSSKTSTTRQQRRSQPLVDPIGHNMPTAERRC